MLQKNYFFSLLYLLLNITNIKTDIVQLPLNVTPTIEAGKDWGTGYQVNVVLTNPNVNPTASWAINFNLDSNQIVNSVCDATLESNAGNIKISNPNWNNGNIIAANGSYGFSFIVTNSNANISRTLSNLTAVGTFNVTPTPNPDPNPTPTPTPTPGSIALTSSPKIDSDWTDGYQVTVTLKNTSSGPTTNWSAQFNLPNSQQKINSLWNGNYTVNGTQVSVTNPPWNGGGVIPAGGTTTFGFVVGNATTGTHNILNLVAVGNGTATPGPTPTPVLAAPVLQPINNPRGLSQFQLAWGAVQNAQSYTLQQSTSSSFTNAQTIYTGAATSFNNTASVGTYYYRVNATSGTTSSNQSNIVSVVVTQTNPNPTPVLSAPVLQQINNPTGASQFQLIWGAVQNAQSYTLQQSTSSSFTNAQTIYTGTATSFNNTASAGTYYFRVKATSGATSSNQSNTVSTTVSQAPQPQPQGRAFVEGYWESWSLAEPISAIVKMKNDIFNISFINFTTTGTNTYKVSGLDCDQATLTQFIKAVHDAGKKVKIALGGASYPLGSQLKTTQDAVGMAKALAEFVQQNNLDGVDFDIEDFPAANLQIALIQNTRQLLGNNKLISYTPMTPASTTVPYPQVLKGAHQYLDGINIMAYNAYQGYSYQQDVNALIAMGIPASKILVGLMPGNDDIGIPTSLATISAASQFVLKSGLAGIMFWSLNRDYKNATGLGANAATNTAWNIIHA